MDNTNPSQITNQADSQISQDVDTIISSLPIEVQDLLSQGIWEDRVRDASLKYGLSNEQTEVLIDDVLFVLIGVDKPEELPDRIKADLGVSSLLTEQIVDELERRVFDYAVKFIDEKTTSQFENQVAPEKPTANTLSGTLSSTLSSTSPSTSPYPDNLPTEISVPKYATEITKTPPNNTLKTISPIPTLTYQNTSFIKQKPKTQEKSFAGRYARLMSISEEEYWNHYEELPEILKLIFVSNELSAELDDIARTNRLNEEQTKSLVLLMGDIILDVQKEEDQDNLIQKYLGVDSYVSKKLSFGLKNRITENVEGLYKKIQSNIEREGWEKKQQIQKEAQKPFIPPIPDKQPVQEAKTEVKPEPKKEVPVFTPPPKPTPPNPPVNTLGSSPGSLTAQTPKSPPNREIRFRPAGGNEIQVTTQVNTIETSATPAYNTEPKVQIPELEVEVKPRITLTEEELRRPLGQGSGSRPFGSLSNSLETIEEKLQEKARDMLSKERANIVFGQKENLKQNNPNANSWQPASPDKITNNINDQVYKMNERSLDKDYWPQNDTPERSSSAPVNIEMDKPAFPKKFNATFNDPLKDLQKDPRQDLQTINNSTPSNIRNMSQEKPGLRYTPQGEKYVNERLTNSTTTQIERVQTSPIAHEYVVDPYREPV